MSLQKHIIKNWERRWETLKKLIDEERKAATERMELEHPMLDGIYRAMFTLEKMADYPIESIPPLPPKTDKPLSVGMEAKGRPPRPPVVCFCGSARFANASLGKIVDFSCDGEIVLSIGLKILSAQTQDPELKRQFNELHLRKIDLADRVFILNVGGYIGDSTCRELAYALGTGKRVAFLEPEAGEEFIKANRGRLDALIKELGVEEW